MKKYIVPLCVFLVVLLGVILFFSAGKKDKPKELINFDKKLSELKQLNFAYELRNQKYIRETDSLKANYLESKSALQQQWNENKRLRNRLKVFVQTSLSTNDTILYKQIDSLRLTSDELIDSSAKSDSLSNAQINRLENLVKLQNEQIQAIDSSYKEIQNQVSTALETNQTLQTENLKLKQQLKRRKILDRVAGATLILATTIVGAIILTH